MLQSSPTIITRCLKVSVIIANILTFLIGTAHIKNSSNIHQQLKNMLYTAILLSCRKSDFFARKRLRALIVLFFAHDMQIQVAHALCKQCCRLIIYTANIRLVTIAACYNCPRSPLRVVFHCQLSRYRASRRFIQKFPRTSVMGLVIHVMTRWDHNHWAFGRK